MSRAKPKYSPPRVELTGEKCAREGCKRMARGDEYCGTICFRLDHGTLEYDPNAKKENRNRKVRLNKLREQHGGNWAEFDNPDAMSRVLDQNYGGGLRGQGENGWKRGRINR